MTLLVNRAAWGKWDDRYLDSPGGSVQSYDVEEEEPGLEVVVVPSSSSFWFVITCEYGCAVNFVVTNGVVWLNLLFAIAGL